MFNKNKHAIMGSFIVLFFTTLFIAVILISFLVVSGLVKSFDNAYNGEKIYKDDEVGVGNLKDSMKDYSRFVNAQRLVKDGQDIDVALTQEKYGYKPNSIPNNYYGDMAIIKGDYYVRK